MSIDTIFNYVQLTERIATSGQPTKKQFIDIANKEYKAIINIAMPDSDNAIQDEGSIVTFLGMSYFHIPVPFDAPEKSHLVLFLKLLKGLEENKIWVHCALNYRVSAFMYHHHKLVLKLPDKEAKSVIFENWKPNKVWRKFLAIEASEIAL